MSALQESPEPGDHDGRILEAWKRRPQMLGQAVAILGNRSRAEDVVSDVLANLIELWRRDEGPEHVTTAYLKRAAHNRAIDVAKSDARTRPDTDEIERMHLVDEHDGIRAVDDDDALEFVRVVLARLPEEQSALLREAVGAGTPVRDISEATGRSRGSVSVQLHRARARLRVEGRIALLEAGGAECHAAANKPGATSLRHQATCDHCRDVLQGTGRGKLAFVAAPLAAAAGTIRAVAVGEGAATAGITGVGLFAKGGALTTIGGLAAAAAFAAIVVTPVVMPDTPDSAPTAVQAAAVDDADAMDDLGPAVSQSQQGPPPSQNDAAPVIDADETTDDSSAGENDSTQSAPTQSESSPPQSSSSSTAPTQTSSSSPTPTSSSPTSPSPTPTEPSPSPTTSTPTDSGYTGFQNCGSIDGQFGREPRCGDSATDPLN